MATILIVDDLSANRKVLVVLLRERGHHTIEAVNGQEALAITRAERPDLIITDVLMPVMDGYELVRQLRLDPLTASLPIVFYTAHYGEREARALAASGGVSFVLIKPVDPEEVLTVVARALASEPPASAPLTPGPLVAQYESEHLRLLTDKLSTKSGDLRTANARLRALINIGLELASERDSGRLLESVCVAARELFAATYVTLGILDRSDHSVRHFHLHGTNADPWIKKGDAVFGLLARIVAERRTLKGDNPGGDPHRLELPAGHPEVRAFLIAAITSPTHAYGWICLVHNEGKDFDEEDQDLITALSGQVGRIYENGYFYSVAKQRADELEREVTERRRAELAVRHERDRAQRYLDTAEVILLALDLNARITLVNRKACDLLGWTEEELLGRDWIEMCLPEGIRERIRRDFRRVLWGVEAIVESPVQTRSGKELMIEWRNSLLRDDKNSVIGTFSSGSDVTERDAAVDALRTAEERMRFALESASVGIWDMDYRTGVLRWSETLEAQYGLRPHTFRGTFDAFIERVHPDDRDEVIAAVTTAMKSGADFSVQHRSIWPDGTIRWLNGAGRIVADEHGEPLRGIGISLDVTERRELEQQYQQAQKMEAVGRLAGGVAHDFNNLLTAILGYCELLLADVQSQDPAREDISEIQKAGARAADLTRQLLAFSRKQIIEPKLLDLKAIISDLQGMLGRLIGADVNVVFVLAPDVAQVKADRGQVQQIVMNLAVNARDAMPNGGTLTIETANIEVDDQHAKRHANAKPGPYVVLKVSDTGTGMPPEVKARLFEPFFTTKEPGKGTGLGMATVHGIATQSGGMVEVESEVGKGTAFSVFFPRADVSGPVAEAPARVVHPQAGGTTVLVVDDDEALRQLTKKLLTRQGYTVLLAGNAAEALRVVETNTSIDVLLTDVVMPGASGPELTQQLVEQRPMLNVIYMSGYTEDAIVHHGVLKPGIAFLNKPFTSQTLVGKIREVLEGG